jgi:hypothetical protein
MEMGLRWLVIFNIILIHWIEVLIFYSVVHSTVLLAIEPEGFTPPVTNVSENKDVSEML